MSFGKNPKGSTIRLSMAIFFGLSVLGNILDIHSNYLLVHHVLAMDTIPSNDKILWRSIQSPLVGYTALWCIILTESLIALFAFYGAIKLFLCRHKNIEVFFKAKIASFFAIFLAISLYFFGFLCIGSQWFRMWQSETYNKQIVSFELVITYCLLFIIIKQIE